MKMFARFKIMSAVVLVTCLSFVATSCMPFTKDDLSITAYFEDSSGLFIGNDVGILGVPVGKITSITPVGDRVKVELKVDADQKVPADAGAVVVARSVATDRYVELTPVYHSGPTMKSGAVIEQDRTKTPVDFDTVLASLNTLAKGLTGTPGSANVVGQAVDELDQAIGGKGPLIHQTINNLSSAVDGMSDQREDFTSTIESLNTLTTTVAQNQQTVLTFIDQVDSATAMLNDERANFQQAMRQVSDTIELVAEFVKTNKPALAHFLGETTKLMESMMSRKATLDEAMRVFPLSLQNMSRNTSGGKLHVAMPLRMFVSLGGLVRTLCNLTQDPSVCAVQGPLNDIGDLLDIVLGLKGK
ncbi:MAG: MCE family protein [Nocardioidaceae bacterium]|nr:MCE family protein [Nocardioidaceae bacterium]MCB8992923.1 MCE family protein [Nocardioidaceae bacterium]MCO5324939.1 MCE family protein [Nocardioidaceae bacterium]